MILRLSELIDNYNISKANVYHWTILTHILYKEQCEFYSQYEFYLQSELHFI